jgi:hypothetical protein
MWGESHVLYVKQAAVSSVFFDYKVLPENMIRNFEALPLQLFC